MKQILAVILNLFLPLLLIVTWYVHPVAAAVPDSQPATQPVLVDSDLAAYVPPANPPTSQLLVGGSGSMERLINPLVEKFRAINPQLPFQINLSGSAAVCTELGAARCNVGLMSRPMSEAEHKQFRDRMGHDPLQFLVAADAILILVNKDNPTEGITLPQLDAIYGTQRLAGYQGDVQSWSNLGATGQFGNSDIHAYGLLGETNGTCETFGRLVLKGGKFSPGNRPFGITTDERGQSVANDPAGISFNIFRSPVDGAKELGVATEAGKPFIKASIQAMVAGSYPLTRGLYIYLSDTQDPSSCEFIRFVLSRDGQRVIAGTRQAASITAKAAKVQLDAAKL